MLSFKPLLFTPILIFLPFLLIPTRVARADCVLSEQNFALARVVTKQARLYYSSGSRKGASDCPSAADACRLQTYLLPGDEVLTNSTEGPYVCARFKSQKFVETLGWLPRAALDIIPTEHPSVGQWAGAWRRDSQAKIVIKSDGDDVTVSGNATWGANDPQRVKRGAINTGELEGSLRPRNNLLAIGYDPDQSGFPPADDAAPDICTAELELYGRYLVVDDNGKCGGLNVTFSGLYVRVNSK
jgi:hypothetical protein